jgi:hypothetical protein
MVLKVAPPGLVFPSGAAAEDPKAGSLWKQVAVSAKPPRLAGKSRDFRGISLCVPS